MFTILSFLYLESVFYPDIFSAKIFNKIKVIKIKVYIFFSWSYYFNKELNVKKLIKALYEVFV